METTIAGYIGITEYIFGLYWDSGKENGNYYIVYRDTGKRIEITLFWFRDYGFRVTSG